MQIILGLCIPFLGTTLGSACVFFLKNKLKDKIQKSLLGFAAGVMVAASVWSLLIPAIEMSKERIRFAFIPPTVGFILGIALLLALDKLTPHMHLESDKPEGMKSSLGKTTMLLLAVTLHNIPEGMAVGVIFASLIAGEPGLTLAGAYSLAIGIAIQNFPEGAVISLPLRSEGKSRLRSFILGTLSGLVEPIASVITVLLAKFIVPILPYLLALAAGSMIYVVVEELIPEASGGDHSNVATLGFSFGFIVMMVMDVTFG